MADKYSVLNEDCSVSAIATEALKGAAAGAVLGALGGPNAVTGGIVGAAGFTAVKAGNCYLPENAKPRNVANFLLARD